MFVAVAAGLAWAVALPLWAGDGLQSPLFRVFAVAMMFTPTIAALVVVFFVEKPRHKARALGLVPLRPVGRLIGYLALGFVIPVVICFAALPLGAFIGVFPADFAGLSGFRQITEWQLAQAGIDELPMPIEALAALQIVNLVIGAFFLNLVPALGEEIGWRGWLLPKLLPLGPWAAIGLSGVIWGLWHAPLILLGYNYPGTPGWLAILAMIALSTVIGGVFGWLRLRGGSVWPAALAHSTFNAAATLYVLFVAENSVLDPLHATVTGWTGWIVPAVLVVFLVLLGRFRPVTAPPSSVGLDGSPTRTVA
ncbi:CPBP family intramembrane metalloprotease [Microbacterium marinilacus]|uniref:CPBP family intramembrane metalloprotease n=1 Tax=Microbacterium marinilacus TaxID=415209 RepID=A0ABP7B2E3_9MICO